TIRNIRETVDTSESLIQNHDEWILTNGSHVLQTADEVSSKVWLSDIHNPNLLKFSAITRRDNYVFWDPLRTSAHWILNDEWLRVRTICSDAQNYFGVYSPELSLVKGETYTVSFEAFEHFSDNTSGSMNYVFMTGENFSNIGLVGDSTRTPVASVAGTTTYLYQSTFVASENSDKARLLIGTRVKTNGTSATFYFKQPKLEVGNRATPYHNSFSNLTQRADELMLAVQGIGEQGFLNQSDIVMRPDYVQLGSQRLDGSNIGSL